MGAECDAAILDLQLGWDSSAATAEALQVLGIPCVFASGYGADSYRSNSKVGQFYRRLSS